MTINSTPAPSPMKKCYWMWKGQGDKQVIWLTDRMVEEMKTREYQIIPYDPNISVSSNAA
jgi:phage major head subunit gpT-like protein